MTNIADWPKRETRCQGKQGGEDRASTRRKQQRDGSSPSPSLYNLLGTIGIHRRRSSRSPKSVHQLRQTRSKSLSLLVSIPSCFWFRKYDIMLRVGQVVGMTLNMLRSWTCSHIGSAKVQLQGTGSLVFPRELSQEIEKEQQEDNSSLLRILK